MKIDKNTKIALFAIGTFVVATASNIVGSAIYTHSKIGIDWKKVAMGTAVGVGGAILLMKLLKKDAL